MMRSPNDGAQREAPLAQSCGAKGRVVAKCGAKGGVVAKCGAWVMRWPSAGQYVSAVAKCGATAHC